MTELSGLFRLVQGVPVITAPAEIDIIAARHLRTALRQATASGHATVVIDMTGTQLCDSAGLHLLVRAHKQAMAEGGELRLVIPAGATVLRVFTLTGVDRVIPRFASVRQAVAQGPAAARPLRANTLEWSLTAMSEATGRLTKVQVDDRPRALAAIGEAVWWTITVDAMLVQHRRDAYQAGLAALPAVERRRTEATLAGLRFVWNRIGRDTELAKLIQGAGAGPGQQRVTDWTWKPARMPALGRLRARGEAWEVTRYRAYQAQLAGHSIGEAFTQTVPFLTAAGADTAPGHDAADPVG